ncbi:hypothetical protein POUND7_007441 [Theobroma cacao]
MKILGTFSLMRQAKDDLSSLYFDENTKGSAFESLSFLTCFDTEKKKKNKFMIDWVRPCFDSIKFNVDGAARGYLGATGIEGTLRGNNGNIRILFSKSVGTMDSNLAEIYAIKETLLLLLLSLGLALMSSLWNLTPSCC